MRALLVASVALVLVGLPLVGTDVNDPSGSAGVQHDPVGDDQSRPLTACRDCERMSSDCAPACTAAVVVTAVAVGALGMVRPFGATAWARSLRGRLLAGGVFRPPRLAT